MVTVDIQQERVGAFVMNAEFPLPREVSVDDRGEAIESGDILDLDPYPNVRLTLEVAAGDSDAPGLTCRTLSSRVDADDQMMMDGQPLTRVSADELLNQLARVGVTVWMRHDCDRYLTRHAVLGLYGDGIEIIWFGDEKDLRLRTRRDITNPQHVAAIVAAATATRPGAGGARATE